MASDAENPVGQTDAGVQSTDAPLSAVPDTASASTSQNEDDFDMPPPPSRKSNGSSATEIPAAGAATEDAFDMPPPPDRGKGAEAPKPARAAKADEKARAAALAAARSAASHVTPGQRDRAISEAAAAAYAASRGSEDAIRQAKNSSSEKPPTGSGPPKSMPSYVAPDWGGLPEGVDYSLEIMKSGQILGQQGISHKAFCTVGRSPECDMFLEHPSISRLHAVIQFRAEDRRALLYDSGSVHGTWLNKRRLKPKVYAPLSVGDVMKFGQSSRLFILGGPSELMPEEGLSRSQLKQLAALEAKEARKQREAEVAKAQMAAALNRGISWGMGTDAVEEEDSEGGTPSVDWRQYAETHSLNDKQQKLADKLRRLENRIRNLTTEADRIKAKQSKMEELTAGQAAVLAHNEQAVDKATEDMEDLEEMLNESIADTLRGKKRRLEGEASLKSNKKRKGAEEEDEDQGSSGDDDFYDRTAPGKARRPKDGPEVHDAASLFGKKEALLEDRKKLEQQLAEEIAEEERITKAGSGGNSEVAADKAADPLDAFMSDVAVQLEHSKVERIRKDIADLDAEVANIERLLKLADPDGYFKAGTRAAAAAREEGLRVHNLDKERNAALEKQRRQKLAAKKAEEEAAKLFIPETEDEAEPAVEPAPHPEGPKPPAAADVLQMVNRLEADMGEGAGGLEVCKKPGDPAKARQLLPSPPENDVTLQAASVRVQPQMSKQQRDAAIRKALAATKQQQAAGTGPEEVSAEDRVLADLELLRKAQRATEEAGKEEQEAVWQPPQGQKGDGKTALNEKLGY